MVLTGCWSSHEVSTLGINVCLGIDKGDAGYIISEQVISAKAIASTRSINESPVVVYTAEGANIQETIARLTTVAARKIYNSHLRMVIISEEIAEEGIEGLIDYLLRYHEYRTDFYFAIAKGASAKDILSILTPIESIPGVEMYNKLKTSYEEWAPTKAIKIIELANDLAADGINPVINAVELADDHDKTNSIDVLKKSSNYEKLRFTNIGVFKKDKLVGWLNEDESKGYNYIMGNVKHTSAYASDGNGIELSSDVLKAKSKITATIDNDQPKIDIDIQVEFSIVGVKGDLDVSKVENIGIVNKMAEEKLSRMCEESVRKAKELQTDIFGFGERVHTKDPAYWKTVKDSWNDVFIEIPVNIKVTAKMMTTGDITKSLSQKD